VKDSIDTILFISFQRVRRLCEGDVRRRPMCLPTVVSSPLHIGDKRRNIYSTSGVDISVKFETIAVNPGAPQSGFSRLILGVGSLTSYVRTGRPGCR
jgi:hypothetical protein